MSDQTFNKRTIRYRYLFVVFAVLMFCIFQARSVAAHQQPTTLVMLDVKPDKVEMELQIPLSELELAFGHNVAANDEAVRNADRDLRAYLLAHIRPETAGKAWTVTVENIKIEKAVQTQSGEFREITVQTELIPPPGVETRNFSLNYDVIMHQVVSHRALVSLRSDWETGIVDKPTEAGVIMVNTATTQIFPLEVNLEKGSAWTGFKSMVSLGMAHIKEGTDHLLFLLVLLLPAGLLARGKKWGEFGGTSYAVKRLLKIVTAFTVGHSITLLIGALNLFQMPPQPVEVLIAASILVSAAHAVRPIFAGKEIYIAAGFGLVHGLAFATVLADLHLGAFETALSILGFNIGIELMQLFVIALVAPWFILLSMTPVYKFVRIAGAALAGIAATGWIAERVSGSSNFVSEFVQNISAAAPAGILILAVFALAVFGFRFFKNNQTSVLTQQ